MKKAKRYFTTVLILFFFTTGCKDSFLEVPPTGAIREDLLTTWKGIEGALTASYAVLTGRYGTYSGSSNWFWGSILGGDANKGSNSGDQQQMNEVQRYATLPTNVSVPEKYKAPYEGIARANSTLLLLSKASQAIPEEDKKRIEGEARFLRGHYYFDLKKIFNDTPYIDEKTGDATVKNDKSLWTMIEADFKFAYDNLPEKQKAVGRVNKWAAAAYLGKTYLYQGKDNKGKYKQAKDIFDKVINEGTTSGGIKYDLMEKYSELFLLATSDNNKEAVFQVQTAVNTGSGANALADHGLNWPYGGSAPGGCCGFYQPSFELVNSFRTDATGLPLLDGSYNNKTAEVENDYGIVSEKPFTPDKGNLDARLDHSVGRRGIPYLNWGDHPGAAWVRDQAYAGPYAPKKFIMSKGDVTDGGGRNMANNYPLIRFADVLLMAAEAEVEAGSLETARSYVNRVRKRAANPAGFVTRKDDKNKDIPAANYVVSVYSTAWTDPNFARKAVRFERKLELSGEGHRFFDLVRWGIAKEAINAYLQYEGGKLTVAFGGAAFTENRSEYQPIPQAEIDLVGKDKLEQNKGYK